jgi:hypothetical protein
MGELLSLIAGRVVQNVDCNHDIGSLYHRMGALALDQLQFVNGFIGDRRSDNGTANGNTNMGSRLTFFNLDDRAWKNIASTEFHMTSSFGGAGSGRSAKTRESAPVHCPSIERSMVDAKNLERGRQGEISRLMYEVGLIPESRASLRLPSEIVSRETTR